MGVTQLIRGGQFKYRFARFDTNLAEALPAKIASNYTTPDG